MKEEENIPELKEMEKDKLDLVILQLQTISSELILANAQARRQLLSDRSAQDIYALCESSPTIEELVSNTKLDEAHIQNALTKIMQAGLVETYIDKDGNVYYETTVPRSGWWVGCKETDHRIYLSHNPLSLNGPWCRTWGPFPNEPAARAFANANFPGWQCTC